MNSQTNIHHLHHRGIRYVDHDLQKWLLVALVLLETGLAAASVWLLHWRLNLAIEETLYSVHIDSSMPIMVQLVQEAFPVLALFVGVNVIALLIADGIWHRYVYSVLRSFMTLIGKTSRLDFSADPHGGRHEVLVLTAIWRARERKRLSNIHQHVARLNAAVSANGSPKKIRQMLDGFEDLLVVASAADTDGETES